MRCSTSLLAEKVSEESLGRDETLRQTSHEIFIHKYSENVAGMIDVTGFLKVIFVQYLLITTTF